MTRVETRSRPKSRSGRGASPVRRYLPPQHGAWAMLAVPILAGLMVAGASWPVLPLVGAWFTGYLFSYYLFQAVKTGKWWRWRPQLTLYGCLTAPLLLVLLWAAPAVLWYAPAFAALWTINAWYAWRRRERALMNDLAAVLQTGLIVPVMASVTGADVVSAVGPAVACLGYFAGTAIYVKTMIRRRDDLSYRKWSVAYHAAPVAAAALASWQIGPLPMVFALWLLVRAWLLPGRGLRPLPVGLIEIGNSVLLLAVIAMTWS